MDPLDPCGTFETIYAKCWREVNLLLKPRLSMRRLCHSNAFCETLQEHWMLRRNALDANEKCIRCFMMRLVKRLASPPWRFSSSQDSQHLAASGSISQHLAECAASCAAKLRLTKCDTKRPTNMLHFLGDRTACK